jgi:peptidyl-prolyl cis-trans isomerase D
MLQAIREKAQGWIAWAIVILISIPFALWGIQEYLGVGGEPKVAVVDGEEITQRMLDQRTRDFRENLRASLGDAYRADLFEDATLKAEVRDAMIEELVLVKHALDWNLRTSDAQARGFIASIPAFQRDGRFDQLLYDAALRNRGMSPAGFEQSVRQDLAVEQFREGMRSSAFTTEQALAERIRYLDEQRTVRHVRIPAAKFADDVVVEDAALKAFFDANRDRYRTPERVRLAYLVLDAAQLAQLVEVDEGALRGYFDDHRGEFVAREEREVRHILLALAADADDATKDSVREKAASLVEQLRAGADFAALARQHSDDPGSSATGGDLGWIERGIMVPAFEEASFSLQQGAISEPVRTEFGLHIIQVTAARGGADADFDDVRDDVEQSYRRFEAENLYFDFAERLAQTAYENAASLTPAAEELELVVQESDWMTRDSMPSGVLGSPRVVNTAFSEDVLGEGNNSDLIEVGPQQSVVIRVLEHEPAGVEEFDEHRDVIERDFVNDRASAAAIREGAGRLERLIAGELSLEQVAAEYGLEVQGPETVTRNATTLPPEALAAAFAAGNPAADSTVYTGTADQAGDYLALAVDAVRPGDAVAMPDAARDAAAQQLAAQQAEAALRHVIEELRARTNVELLPISD